MPYLVVLLQAGELLLFAHTLFHLLRMIVERFLVHKQWHSIPLAFVVHLLLDVVVFERHLLDRLIAEIFRLILVTTQVVVIDLIVDLVIVLVVVLVAVRSVLVVALLIITLLIVGLLVVALLIILVITVQITVQIIVQVVAVWIVAVKVVIGHFGSSHLVVIGLVVSLVEVVVLVVCIEIVVAIVIPVKVLVEIEVSIEVVRIVELWLLDRPEQVLEPELVVDYRLLDEIVAIRELCKAETFWGDLN